MPACEKFIEQISSLVDGELGEDEARALLDHIDACESCKTVYDSFRFIASALSDELAEAPEHLAASVMEKIRETPRIEKKRPNAKILFLRYGAVAACLALVLLGASRLSLFRMGASAPKAAAGATDAQQYSVMIEPAPQPAAPPPAATEAPAPAQEPEDGAYQDSNDAVFTAGVGGEEESQNKLTGENQGPLMMLPPPKSAERAVAQTLSAAQAEAFIAELLVKNSAADAELPESGPELILTGEFVEGEAFTVYVYDVGSKPLAIVNYNGSNMLFTGDIEPYLTPEG